MEMEKEAVQRAKDRANAAKWDLDIAIFLFLVLVILVILLFQGIETKIAAPIAICGLSLVWLTGWRRGKKLYQRFYAEETFKLERELKKQIKETIDETIEETIEQKVQKALRERWK